MKKTNAARILDSMQIPYQLLEYKVDPYDLSAEDAARKLEVPVEQVFKTLMLRGEKKGVLAACIPGGRELDLKALASFSGDKKIEMVPLREIFSLTGYQRGAVSPLGMKKPCALFLDERAYEFSSILVSAGRKGVQLKLNPEDLAYAVGALSGNITRL